MSAVDEDSAADLAWAFLRRSATSSRYLRTPRKGVETPTEWVFDFLHPRWRDFKRRQMPFGVTIRVNKRTGKTEHCATLRDAS